MFDILDYSITWQHLFASLAITLAIIRYGYYIFTIYEGKTKPHAFSWFNWGLIIGFGAYSQCLSDFQGPSGLVFALTSFICLFIAALSLFYGERNITRKDWVVFLSVLALIPVWKTTQDPLLSLSLLIMIDGASYIPTIRKSWHDPYSEPPTAFILGGIRYFFTIFAVTTTTTASIIYPSSLMLFDLSFAAYLYWRRYVLFDDGLRKLVQSQ